MKLRAATLQRQNANKQIADGAGMVPKQETTKDEHKAPGQESGDARGVGAGIDAEVIRVQDTRIEKGLGLTRKNFSTKLRKTRWRAVSARMSSLHDTPSTNTPQIITPSSGRQTLLQIGRIASAPQGSLVAQAAPENSNASASGKHDADTGPEPLVESSALDEEDLKNMIKGAIGLEYFYRPDARVEEEVEKVLASGPRSMTAVETLSTPIGDDFVGEQEDEDLSVEVALGTPRAKEGTTTALAPEDAHVKMKVDDLAKDDNGVEAASELPLAEETPTTALDPEDHHVQVERGGMEATLETLFAEEGLTAGAPEHEPVQTEEAGLAQDDAGVETTSGTPLTEDAPTTTLDPEEDHVQVETANLAKDANPLEEQQNGTSDVEQAEKLLAEAEHVQVEDADLAKDDAGVEATSETPPVEEASATAFTPEHDPIQAEAAELANEGGGMEEQQNRIVDVEQAEEAHITQDGEVMTPGLLNSATHDSESKEQQNGTVDADRAEEVLATEDGMDGEVEKQQTGFVDAEEILVTEDVAATTPEPPSPAREDGGAEEQQPANVNAEQAEEIIVTKNVTVTTRGLISPAREDHDVTETQFKSMHLGQQKPGSSMLKPEPETEPDPPRM
ncbi:hypothetical protein K458DRAFT_399150 [Lentithecium fluviatile CBS 122367]|uniref:Uncharacterized protein n=1 Tax=Lentithecium fluviatile CBS 122367 TaxID=1168545 RepID=A0A6G1JM71_9PLEO|nr:hypothetical protein K458DRAFT_399150 [Lentithecium fluviatile CBS 122367]